MTATDEVKQRAMNDLGVDHAMADRIVEFIESERKQVAWTCLAIAQANDCDSCSIDIDEEFDLID